MIFKKETLKVQGSFTNTSGTAGSTLIAFVGRTS